MLKNNIEITHKIIRYTPDIEAMAINVEIATGNIVDGKFVTDRRELIKHRIVNEPERAVRKTESLTVDVNGKIEISLMSIDGNPIEIDGTTQDHVSGQSIDCAGYHEGDMVSVAYYYIVTGRDWFNEAAAYRQVDHPECIGMNDYEYNSHRIWSILMEMGLVSGDIV